jgi:hypothetical protein
VALTRNARFALLAVAATLLVVGLAGPVRRAVDERERARASAALAEQVARENAAIAAEFATHRVTILAEVRALIDRGETRQAMTRAARYLSTGNAGVFELHREAANAESQRQRAEAYRTLVQSSCTEAEVRRQVATMLAAPVEPAVTVDPMLALTRLAEPEAREVVLTRLREPAPPHGHGTASAWAAAGGWPLSVELIQNASVKPGPVDWMTSRRIARLREDNRARPLPDYLVALQSPMAGDVTCAWRVGGRGKQGSLAFAFTMDVWMAPAPDGKSLAADPVRYVERPL